MAIGQDFYPDAGLNEISNLSRTQAGQALTYGDIAARYADPFMDQRKQYQNQLSTLMANPGSFASSPAYQFAYDQGLNALQRKGGVRSGAKLAALMKYGQDRASQLYTQQANLLSNLAMSGSSPAAAGIAFARGADRSQDYQQMAAAARNAGRNQPAPQNQTPWWMQPAPGMGGGGGQPSRGGYGMPSGSYVPSVYDTPYVTANTPGYTPSAGAGTGYITGSGGGAAVFGQGGFATNGVPLIQGGDLLTGGYDYGGYAPYDYGSYGAADYGGGYSDYSDYSGEEY